MDWTQAVGAAFLNQPQDVMDSVQRLRALAQANQNLQNTAQEQVVADDGAIRIEPVNPDVIYVPAYDPVLIYAQPCPVTFGIGFPIGLWFSNDFDWHQHWVIAGGGWVSALAPPGRVGYASASLGATSPPGSAPDSAAMDACTGKATAPDYTHRDLHIWDWIIRVLWPRRGPAFPPSRSWLGMPRHLLCRWVVKAARLRA